MCLPHRPSLESLSSVCTYPPTLPNPGCTLYLLTCRSATFRPWHVWMKQTLARLWEGSQSLFTRSMAITWFFRLVLKAVIWKVGCTIFPSSGGFTGILEPCVILGILWLQPASPANTIFFVWCRYWVQQEEFGTSSSAGLCFPTSQTVAPKSLLQGGSRYSCGNPLGDL